MESEGRVRCLAESASRQVDKLASFTIIKFVVFREIHIAGDSTKSEKAPGECVHSCLPTP